MRDTSDVKQSSQEEWQKQELSMNIWFNMYAKVQVMCKRASQEKWQNQERKYKQMIENACGNTSDAKLKGR